MPKDKAKAIKSTSNSQSNSSDQSKTKTKAKEAQAKETPKEAKKPTLPAWTALKRLAPALKRVLSPERGNIWFDDGRAFAVGAYMGIEVPFDEDLECGVQGDLLLKMLESTSGEPKLEVAAGTLSISWGNSNVEMRTMPVDRSKGIWKFPTSPPKGATGLVLSKELLAAFKRVNGVRARVPNNILHQGIVGLPQKGGIDLYSTNSFCLGKTSVAMEMPKGASPLIFPYELVDVMLEYCQPEDKLFILEDSLAIFGKALNIFIGRLDVEDKTLLKIAAPVKDFAVAKGKAPIPALLGSVLARAQLLAGKSEKTLADTVSLEADGDELSVTGKLALGKLSETLPCKLPTCYVRVSASRLAGVLNGVVKDISLVEDKGIVLTGENATFLVAGVTA